MVVVVGFDSDVEEKKVTCVWEYEDDEEVAEVVGVEEVETVEEVGEADKVDDGRATSNSNDDLNMFDFVLKWVLDPAVCILMVLTGLVKSSGVGRGVVVLVDGDVVVV